MIEYLINNLINKMQVVNFQIDVAENIRSFLTDKLNDKWFDSCSNVTNFFSNKENATKYIGLKQKNGKDITITYRDKKYIQWLFCSGKKFSDEQIKELLQSLSRGKEGNKIIAKKIFGEEIICKDIEEEIGKYPKCLKFEKTDKIGNTRNVASITITLPELEEKEEKCDETE